MHVVTLPVCLRRDDELLNEEAGAASAADRQEQSPPQQQQQQRHAARSLLHFADPGGGEGQPGSYAEYVTSPAQPSPQGPYDAQWLRAGSSADASCSSTDRPLTQVPSQPSHLTGHQHEA